MPWRDPETIAAAHDWLSAVAREHGIAIAGPIARPHVRPWSTVFRAETERGAIFLKLCGASQAHEPALTALLVREIPDLLPRLIAVHPHEPWMLMMDGGLRIRDAHAADDLLRAWEALLPRYAVLQRRFLGHELELRATGTPDRSLDRLTSDLERVIDDERVLAPLADDAYASGPRELRALLPDLPGLCAELARLGIGPTIQHDDLHDANVLVRGGRAVVFDWGDACVTHPFISLPVVLRSAALRAGLGADAPAIRRLRDAYLEPWDDLAPAAALRRAADIATRIGGVTRALCWHRVVTLSVGALEYATAQPS